MLFVALFEPRDVGHALSDLSWVNATHEEFENFERNQVWTLVEPNGFLKTNRGRMVRLLGTKLALLLKSLEK
jgi:hypothetical protein